MERKLEDYVNCSVRIRPKINQDTTSTSCLEVISNDPPVLVVLERPQTYHFDNIFTEDNDQETVYKETVKPLVEFVKRGYNCTVFAYGQTGTGKTYTMGTNPQVKHQRHRGLISRALEDFFNNCDDNEMDVHVSFIEIYNEKVFDLLINNNKVPLMVKGFNVQGASKERVFNTSEANHFLETGNKNRHTAGTKQNLNSSRSHAIFTIYCNIKNGNIETSSKLNLVDLAGSESVKKTGNQGNTFHEGININKGLLCIGQVMTALTTNSSFIPYRQSIITTILQDSLNKKNYVTLIACVNSNAEDSIETVQTLEFAQRVKKMRNKPELNEVIAQYKKENPILFNPIRTNCTPFKRPNPSFQTPAPKKFRPLPLIPSNEASSTSVATESPKSLFLSSISSITNDALTQQTLSPVVRKYVTAMECSLMDKLETVIKNTLKRPSRQSPRAKNDLLEDKENTPKVSWNRIQSEVSKLVKSEIALMTEKAVRATSSPIETEQNEKIRRVLNYESPDQLRNESNLSAECEIVMDFKVPEVPVIKKKKSKLTPNISPIESNNVRRSMRLSMKRAKFEESVDASIICNISGVVERKTRKENSSNISVYSENTSRDEEIHHEKIGRRRSVRLAKKKTARSPAMSRIQKKTPKKGHKIRNVSTDSPYTSHSKKVLYVLNAGTLKDLEKLHSIGAKTAEQIILFRKLKGSFKKIDDIAQIPGWSVKKCEKFISSNFLRKD